MSTGGSSANSPPRSECAPTTKRLIRDYAFKEFSPEGVAVSGALTTAATMLVGLAGSAVLDFRRGGPLAGAIIMAYLVVAITILTVIVAGVMDKRAHVRNGFIATAVHIVAGLAAGGYYRYQQKKKAQVAADAKAQAAANASNPFYVPDDAPSDNPFSDQA